MSVDYPRQFSNFPFQSKNLEPANEEISLVLWGAVCP
jgi:hypothetical protein